MRPGWVALHTLDWTAVAQGQPKKGSQTGEALPAAAYVVQDEVESGGVTQHHARISKLLNTGGWETER